MPHKSIWKGLYVYPKSAIRPHIAFLCIHAFRTNLNKRFGFIEFRDAAALAGCHQRNQREYFVTAQALLSITVHYIRIGSLCRCCCRSFSCCVSPCRNYTRSPRLQTKANSRC
jgi:predicted transcriptional regulator